MQKQIIYLDQDGVLSDFVGEFCKLFGKEYVDIQPLAAPADYYGCEKALGVTGNETVQVVAKAGEKFWEDMPTLPWANRLYTELCELGRVVLCTKPMSIPGCYSGKIKWLNRVLPGAEIVLIRDKSLLAKPNTLLIDDCDANCNDFKAAGGAAITFPRYWNHRYGEERWGVDKTIIEAKTIIDWHYDEKWHQPMPALTAGQLV